MKDIVRRIREIESELARRRAGNALSQYNTGRKKHRKQLAFHRCKKRNRWVFGGNRSGKTECGAAEAVYMARGCHPYRTNKPDVSGWVVSLSGQVQRDVAQQKILHYLDPRWIGGVVMQSGSRGSPAYGVIDYILVKNVFGGISRIGFKSCDQGREKFQGASLDFVWFDEEPPLDIYEECRMRVLDRRGDLFGTMTPLKGLSWVYEEIYRNCRNDPNIWCRHMEWADNPFLSKKETAALTASLSESQLSSRRYGRFCESLGLVYPEFDPALHVIDPFRVPAEWQDTLSIDPGLNNPLSCHWFAVDFDGNVYVTAEHYEAGRDVAYHASKIHDISRRIGWKTDAQGRVCALIDSAASQRTLAAQRSVAELFSDHGILVSTRVDKDVFAGISRVKSYFKNADGKARLYIFKTCPNLIRELKGYFWGEGDVPRKKDDHAVDALRYYIMHRPETPRPAVALTDIQKDMQRRMRALRRRRGK